MVSVIDYQVLAHMMLSIGEMSHNSTCMQHIVPLMLLDVCITIRILHCILQSL